jgi:hypothetical protein
MHRTDFDPVLADLGPSFEADDFRVELDSVTDEGDVVICIEATPNACLECLVPDPMLQQIVEASVRRHVPEVGRVSVVKRGFEALDSAH